MCLMHNVRIMRTTISVEDQLLVAAKRRARDLGLTLGQLIERGLQRELALAQPGSRPPEIPVFRGGTGPRPGIDLDSNRSLHETVDEGLPLEKLR